MRRLELVCIGSIRSDPALPLWLGQQLQQRLGLPVQQAEAVDLCPDWFDASRGQYHSSQIVDFLILRDERRPHLAGRWVLGVTEVDLFAEDRDFVFGEATQGGRWAVISLARLHPGPSAHSPASLLRRRALKEAVHEVGHLAGLTHCSRPECVMFASPGLRETDAKAASFCPACRSALAAGQGLDPPQSRR